MHRFARPTAPGLVLAVLLATLAAPRTEAVTLNWANAAGGSASTAANWSPAQAPVNADDLRFALAAAFGVTFDAGADTVRNWSLAAGNSSLAITGQHVATGTLTLGTTSGDTLATELTAGTLRVKGAIRVADNGRARLSVAGETARLVGESTVVGGSAGGTIARINVLGGGRLESTGNITFGTNGACSTLVRGSGAVNLQPSLLKTAGTLSLLNTSRLDVMDGALLQVARDLSAGPANTGANTGFRVTNGARVEVGDDLLLWRDNFFNIGTHSVVLDQGASVLVAESTLVGSPLNSQASVQVASGALLDTRALLIYDSGAFTNLGGRVVIRGGPYFDQTRTNLPNLAGAMELRDGATATFSSASGDALSMLNGAIRVTTGSTLAVTQGTVRWAVNGAGALDADSSAVVTLAGNLLTGSSNNASRLTVRGGAHVTAANNIIMNSYPFAPNGPVDVVVSGAGSQLQSDNFTIGASFDGGAGGSPSTARVDSGGVLQCVGVNRAVSIGRAASLTVGAGSVVGPVRVVLSSGRLAMEGGTIDADDVVLSGVDTSTVRGHGTIQARLLAPGAPARVVASGGTLEVGDAADTAGVDCHGELDAGGATLVLRDADGARLAGRVHVGGGVLSCPDAAPWVTGEGRLEGTGLVAAPAGVLVSGTIAPGDSLGRLDVGGALALAGGTLAVQLGDRSTLRSDTLAVAGALALDGATLQVRFAAGFTAGDADTFTVATFASHTGTFAALDLPPAPDGHVLEVRTLGDRVQVVVRAGTPPVGVDGPVAPAVLAFGAAHAPGAAALRLALPWDADAHVSVFDVGGRRVAEFARGPLPAGMHEWRLANGVPSGVYFARAVVTHGRERIEKRVRLALAR